METLTYLYVKWNNTLTSLNITLSLFRLSQNEHYAGPPVSLYS